MLTLRQVLKNFKNNCLQALDFIAIVLPDGIGLGIIAWFLYLLKGWISRFSSNTNIVTIPGLGDLSTEKVLFLINELGGALVLFAYIIILLLGLCNFIGKVRKELKNNE